MFYVSDVHRMNSGPMQQLEHFQTRSAITVEWLYQLYMALEADVWIGTRKSNWNRLIDEMRCALCPRCTRLAHAVRFDPDILTYCDDASHRRLIAVYTTSMHS